MTYSGPFINSIFKTMDINESGDISQIAAPPGPGTPPGTPPPAAGSSGGTSPPRITIEYNATGIDTYTYYTPMLTMSHSYNRTEGGVLLSVLNKINLTGKIYDKSSTTNSLSGLLVKESGLKNLFKQCPIGDLKVKDSNGGTLLSVTGVRAVSIVTEPTQDNMSRSMGYSIDLEYYDKGPDQSGLIISCSDSWTIEPLDDYTYENFDLPYVKRNSSNLTLSVINIPQFRVSHKVSAKGATLDKLCTPELAYNAGYNEAQKWVKQRLAVPWEQTTNASGAYIGAYPPASLNLYNHVRATNFSMTEGSYDVVDTWIGMPSGITYIEDYTVDISSDEKFIKTVRVQGSIRGLEVVASGRVTGDSSLTPLSGKITLSDSLNTLPTTTSKYSNALSAWNTNVKPNMYQKAATSLNRSATNDLTYTDFIRTGASIHSNYNRNNPAQNTSQSKERVLNPIPWSMSENHDHKKGIITYNYEYSNRFTLLSGVLSENISITDNGPADVIAEVFVLGRSLGPALQALGSKTLTTKDLNIEISVIPPTGIDGYNMNSSVCPLWTGGKIYNAIGRVIDGIRPFRPDTDHVASSNTNHQGQSYIDRDIETWNPSEGRYTRSVSWKYQQCQNNKFYLDH